MLFTRFAVLAAAAALATPAIAGPITVSAANVGQSYTIGYDGYTQGTGVIGGLSGQGTFTLTGVGTNSYTFSYSLANTSSNPITNSRISGFGFNTDPNMTSASSTGIFDSAASGNVPSGFGSVEVCFKGGGGSSNCAGGGGAGVNIGDTGTGTLTLNFSELPDQLTLSDFFVRYQSIEGAGGTTSAIGRGTPSSTSSTSTSTSSGASTSTGGTEVPAPGALWLFAAGLAGIGLRFGRRRR
jgi:hypothetical protein